MMTETYEDIWYDVRGDTLTDEEADRIAGAIWKQRTGE